MPNDAPPPVTSAVAIRPPVFYPNNVKAFFAVLETQLANVGVTAAATKTRHLLASLPLDVVEKFTDEEMVSTDYDTIKTLIIELYSKPSPHSGF